MNQRIVAVIVFYDDKKRILLQDRRNFSKLAPWGFFGGQLEPGESPEQALRREIREELGYELDTHEPLGTFEGDYPGLHVVSHVFLTPMPRESTRAFTQAEGQGMRLCSLAEARRLLVYGDQPAILDALEKKLFV